MNNREYTKLVDQGLFPKEEMVPLDEPFRNHAGAIQNLLLEKFTSVAIIESVAGAVRANHYHKTDWHYAYVLKGKVLYSHRPVSEPGTFIMPRTILFNVGEMFFTPPMVEHAMYFPEPTTIITFAKNIRDHESHEADVVRVPLVKPAWNSKFGKFEFAIDPAAMDARPTDK